MRRTARAVLAASLLAVLLIGIPVGLASTIGNPLDSWPAIKAGDLSSQVVIDLLAAVVWLCWAQFAIATALEGWAAARRVSCPAMCRGVQRRPHPGAPGRVLIGPAISSTLTPAVAYGGLRCACRPPPPQPGSADCRPPRSRPPAGDQHGRGLGVGLHGRGRDHVSDASRHHRIVIRGDGPRTFWDLAAAYLGDGQRWPEIWTLNHGRGQPDGTVMTNPALLRLGWTVLIPADTPQAAATRTDVVRPGDTLTAIAAADGLPSWHPLWQANANRPEPDGDRFTNPDLIRPGWVLQRPAPHGAPAASRPTAPPPNAPGTAAASHRCANHGHATQRQRRTPRPGAATAVPPTAWPRRRAARSASTAVAAARSDQSSSTMGRKVAILRRRRRALAGVSLAVSRYRRRQFRFRRPAGRSTTPDSWSTSGGSCGAASRSRRHLAEPGATKPGYSLWQRATNGCRTCSRSGSQMTCSNSCSPTRTRDRPSRGAPTPTAPGGPCTATTRCRSTPTRWRSTSPPTRH